MRKKLDQASGHGSAGADQERRKLLRAMLGGAYVIPLAASLSVDQLDWEYDDDVQLIGGGKKKAAKKKAAR